MTAAPALKARSQNMSNTTVLTPVAQSSASPSHRKTVFTVCAEPTTHAGGTIADALRYRKCYHVFPSTKKCRVHHTGERAGNFLENLCRATSLDWYIHFHMICGLTENSLQAEGEVLLFG